jgi:hypothetical protein
VRSSSCSSRCVMASTASRVSGCVCAMAWRALMDAMSEQTRRDARQVEWRALDRRVPCAAADQKGARVSTRDGGAGPRGGGGGGGCCGCCAHFRGAKARARGAALAQARSEESRGQEHHEGHRNRPFPAGDGASADQDAHGGAPEQAAGQPQQRAGAPR